MLLYLFTTEILLIALLLLNLWLRISLSLQVIQFSVNIRLRLFSVTQQMKILLILDQDEGIAPNDPAALVGWVSLPQPNPTVFYLRCVTSVTYPLPIRNQFAYPFPAQIS